MRRGLVVVAVLAAMVLAGCGGSAGGTAAPAASVAAPAPSMPAPSMPMPSMSMPSAAAAGGGGAAVATSAVSIANFAFSPATVTVHVGTTVTWTNRDQEPHTVTAQDKAFGSAALTTGQSYRHTFTTPGSYSYLCTIHPFMTATVVVTP